MENRPVITGQGTKEPSDFKGKMDDHGPITGYCFKWVLHLYSSSTKEVFEETELRNSQS